MAKDGTNRGGRRVRVGDKPKPLAEKNAAGEDADITPYASVYGDIFMDENGKYHTTGAERTGCMFCMFGCHLEKAPNRFQKLSATHPKIYDYCIGGGAEVDGVWQPNNKGLGLGKVLDYIGVDYRAKEECADE